MSDPIITVENLSKRYLIGHQRSKDDGLRHVLQEKLTAPFRRLRQLAGSPLPAPNSPLPAPRCPLRAPRSEEFWALKDISFEVNRGEAVGIIGRNGAGKSTLLKALSRITEPTRGLIHLKGKVASLLEVGTGFHPELTGRENIFLNGAILGMTRLEIKRKFDEIVAFADIERFLDTPVKRYSSGMYVRLAFAVAAHLDPEILVLDEVLAVGDAAFQKKCLWKMKDVAESEGRTVLFVSHNMGAVSSLCHRALLLKDGQIVSQGPSQAVIGSYLASVLPETTCREFRAKERPEVDLQILSVAVTDPHGELLSRTRLWDSFQVRVDYAVRRNLKGTNIALWVSRDGGKVFVTFDTDLSPELLIERTSGHYRAIVPMPSGLLPAGTYTVSVSTGMPSLALIDQHEHVVSFEVTADDEDLTSKSYSRGGMVMAKLQWAADTLSRPIHD